MVPSDPRESADAALDRLCSLDDPTRRRLYDFVAAQPDPVSRDRAAQAAGVDRSTVAYHLDRLVDEGLLEATFARPAGRTGPGAGRPAKHYARSRREFNVSVPPRDYRLAAEVLARAVEADTDGTVRAALDRVAAELGRELAGRGTDAEPAADLVGHLTAQGFEPYEDEGVVRLRNCPFHRLAREHTELVCGMNLAMLAGVTQSLGARYEARLEPDVDRCCVAFHPTDG